MIITLGYSGQRNSFSLHWNIKDLISIYNQFGDYEDGAGFGWFLVKEHSLC